MDGISEELWQQALQSDQWHTIPWDHIDSLLTWMEDKVGSLNGLERTAIVDAFIADHRWHLSWEEIAAHHVYLNRFIEQPCGEYGNTRWFLDDWTTQTWGQISAYYQQDDV